MSLDDMVTAYKEDQPATFASLFDKEMKMRIADRLDEYRPQVAQTMFGVEGEVDPDGNDDLADEQPED